MSGVRKGGRYSWKVPEGLSYWMCGTVLGNPQNSFISDIAVFVVYKSYAWIILSKSCFESWWIDKSIRTDLYRGGSDSCGPVSELVN